MRGGGATGGGGGGGGGGGRRGGERQVYEADWENKREKITTQRGNNNDGVTKATCVKLKHNTGH